MKSNAMSFLKGFLSYLLFVQVALQVDALLAIRLRRESGEDVSDALLDVFGLFKVEKAIVSLAIAIITAIFSKMCFTAELKAEGKAKSSEQKKVTVAEPPVVPVPQEEVKKVSEKKNVVNVVEGEALDVVLVGCGMPKRGMGWYHLTQLLDMPNANMAAVIEPFFLNKKLCPNPPEAFTELVKELEAAGVKCTDSVAKLPKFEKNTLCLIAGRTNDNPALFKACVAQGAKTIFLEKPGAPSVAELQEMSDWAKSQGVRVYLGYNKNVTPYVQKALALSKKKENSRISFCHNNSYKV